MKAFEWQQFFLQQREQYGKVVFTKTELANASCCRAASLNVTLQRLVSRKIIERYTEGRYGLPQAATIEDIVHSLDTSAYITGMAALHRHQMVTQVPMEIRCFSRRRHNRSRVRDTFLGRIVFVCITGPVYTRPQGSILAGPEQALCDLVFDCRKRGLSADHLVTFRNLDRLNTEQIEACLSRYPKTVAQETGRLIVEG
jgi:hypothetical protein